MRSVPGPDPRVGASSHLKRGCSCGERHDDESSGSDGKGLEETINDALEITRGQGRSIWRAQGGKGLTTPVGIASMTVLPMSRMRKAAQSIPLRENGSIKVRLRRSARKKTYFRRKSIKTSNQVWLQCVEYGAVSTRKRVRVYRGSRLTGKERGR